MNAQLIMFILIALVFVSCITYLILFPVNCNNDRLIKNIINAQHELNVSRDLYRNIVDSMRLAICLLDEKDTIVFVNLKFQQLSGHTFVEILNSNVYSFFNQQLAPMNKKYVILTDDKKTLVSFDDMQVLNIVDNKNYTVLIECSENKSTRS